MMCSFIRLVRVSCVPHLVSGFPSDLTLVRYGCYENTGSNYSSWSGSTCGGGRTKCIWMIKMLIQHSSCLENNVCLSIRLSAFASLPLPTANVM
jgi:hypothetical protein